MVENGWPRSLVRVPAPWVLRGDAYVVLTSSSTQDNLADAGIGDELRPSYRNLFNLLMVVDYQQSPVGPYLEVLYVPGHFRVAQSPWCLSISRIYVSSEASVHNGNANWGLSKSRAEFARDGSAEGVDAFRVGAGKGFAKFAFTRFGPQLSCSSRLLPSALTRFVQVRDGRRYLYSLAVRGRTQAARLHAECFDAAMFPDMTKRKVRLAVHISDFVLDFHEAQTTPLYATP